MPESCLIVPAHNCSFLSLDCGVACVPCLFLVAFTQNNYSEIHSWPVTMAFFGREATQGPVSLTIEGGVDPGTPTRERQVKPQGAQREMEAG